ncbi:MAG TPA: response regulator transcription factor [Planctomycetia bacterium]|nr:response regulator transcription factor [Planctomycetia bacterium]
MKGRILVVEDEEHLAIALRFNFELEGYEVEVAADGVAAINAFFQARLRETPYDLIVLDLMLPRASGYEVCQSVRNVDRETPILVLSAKSLPEDRIQAFDLGTDQYLQKPFSLPELLSRVRNLLERRPGGRPPAETETPKSEIVEFGQAIVNFRTHEVLVAGEPQKLSTLHLQLLRLFIENEGTVLSREEILEKVWGHAFAPSTTRVVDNAMLVLRKTFEPDPARPRHFPAIRGAGYRFVANPAASPDRQE